MSAARAILAVLGGLLLCAAAQAQELNTAFVSQSVPLAMTAGQSYPVSVTLKNTGTWGWGTTSGHFLGSQNPQNNTNWGLNRVPLPHFVGPNQNVTFSFNVTAPATAGTYNFQWRMVNPATYGWFGATTPNVSVQVNVADATFASQSVPSTMVAGQSASVSVTLQNTGGTTWTPGSTTLGSQNPQDNSTWGLNRVALPAPVAPGASATFNFSISAPSTPGTYNFQWRMLEGTSGWFGAPSTNVAVNVISGTPDANVFFIHTDHLNTPRLVASSSGAAVWRWDQQEPFGVSPPDKNPSGLGVFDFPLRHPGQYDDSESGLFYNYFRDCYDPVLGRYCQSDPIGLAGGINTYLYVAANPLSFSDPLGLFKYNAPPPRTVPLPPTVEAKVVCLENCLGTPLVITGGAEQTGHSKGSKHYSGQAVDFGFNSNPGIQSRSAEFYCCALQCGFDYGQTEGGRGPHYHLQTVPGLGVPRIPRDACMCKP